MKRFRAQNFRAFLRALGPYVVSLAALPGLFALMPPAALGQNASGGQGGNKSAEAAAAPNENLVVEGIPPIPAALAEKVDHYTNFRSAFLASWHPTRREMLISTRFADTFQIHEVKMPGGARTQLTFYPDDVRSAQFPPKGGDSFVFSKDIGGGEFYQLYRYDVATGDVDVAHRRKIPQYRPNLVERRKKNGLRLDAP